MKKFKSQWNYVPQEAQYVETEVLTIPNQALTVKELKRRIEAGLALPKLPMEYDLNQTGLPQFRIRDLTDLDRAKKYIADFKRRLNEQEMEIQTKAKAKKNDPVKDQTLNSNEV